MQDNDKLKVELDTLKMSQKVTTWELAYIQYTIWTYQYQEIVQTLILKSDPLDS